MVLLNIFTTASDISVLYIILGMLQIEKTFKQCATKLELELGLNMHLISRNAIERQALIEHLRNSVGV